MCERQLRALSPLGGIDVEMEGVRLRQVTGLAAVMLSVPAGAQMEVDAAVRRAWGCNLPSPGKAMRGEGGVQMLWWGQDQWLVLWRHPPHGEVAVLRERLGPGPVLVEQSGAFVIVELSGSLSVEVLERLCPLDLAGLPPFSVARTGIEHLAAAVLRLDTDVFHIISASSSAWSLWHEVARAADALS